MSAIFAPLCTYTFLLFAMWCVLGYVRISGGLRGTIPHEYFRVGQGPRPADKIVDIHHHFSNQFEIPMLFYLGCLAVFVSESVDATTLTLAWSFVVLRLVHTALVLIKNDPRVRVAPYVLSTLAVWGIWVNLFLEVVWVGSG